MRTHPTFYIGRLRPYYQYEASSAGEYTRHAQEPPQGSLVPSPSYRSGVGTPDIENERQQPRREELDSSARVPTVGTPTPHDRPIVGGGCAAHNHPKRDVPVSLARRGQPDRAFYHGNDQDQPPTQSIDSELIFIPPLQPLVDPHGGQRFHVERILNHRDVKGQRTSYLVLWRGYPPSHDSWERRA